MTANEAELLAGFLSTAAIPFIVSYLKQRAWQGWLKWLIAAFVSTAGGLLTAYAGGKLTIGGGWVTPLLAVYTAASGSYHTWFKGLGFEDWLNPKVPAPALTVDDTIIMTPTGHDSA